jgi:hypothetical protein
MFQRIYGQRCPPSYRLDVVTTPIAIYASSHDWLADPEVKNLGPDSDPGLDIRELFNMSIVELVRKNISGILTCPGHLGQHDKKSFNCRAAQGGQGKQPQDCH